MLNVRGPDGPWSHFERPALDQPQLDETHPLLEILRIYATAKSYDPSSVVLVGGLGSVRTAIISGDHWPANTTKTFPRHAGLHFGI